MRYNNKNIKIRIISVRIKSIKGEAFLIHADMQQTERLGSVDSSSHKETGASKSNAGVGLKRLISLVLKYIERRRVQYII